MVRRVVYRPVVGAAVAALIGLAVPMLDAAPAAAENTLEFEAAAVMLAQSGIDGQVGGIAKDAMRGVRRSWNTLRWMFARAAHRWGRWLRRAAFSLGVALAAALADSGLLSAFRREGLRALVGYVPLMLYVYGRLLFSRGVSMVPKLLLLGALAYGVMRRDLLPDTRLSGRVEDIILIVIATRAFIYACPEDLVNQYAQRAVGFRRRVSELQQRSR